MLTLAFLLITAILILLPPSPLWIFLACAENQNSIFIPCGLLGL